MGYFLSAGNLASTEGCSIGDYRIDWRLNSPEGSLVFVSGNVGNGDGDLDSFHPLVDEIVISGTLYPIIRYVYVSGEKYAPYEEEGSKYSPDLIGCLPPIVVDSINCSTLLNNTSDYNYRLTREVNTGERDRSIKFDLGSTTNYVAWAFTGVQISDKLNVYYCKGNDPDGEIIDSFIIGNNTTTDYTPTNYPRQPGYDPNIAVDPIRVVANTAVRYISDLTGFTYELGDWLRFKVEGNILNPSQDDTKWVLEIKCFETLDLSNNFEDVGKFNSSTFSAIFDETDCRFEVKYSCLDNLNSANNNTSIFIRKYLTTTLVSSTLIGVGNTSTFTTNGTEHEHRLNRTTSIVAQILVPNWSLTSCINLAGEISVQKSGTNLTLSFTSSDDYNLVINNINTAQAHARYTAYLAANSSQLPYYGYYEFAFRVATGCDQSSTTIRYRIHFSTNISYNSPTSITFTLPTITNDYATSTDPCNSVWNTIDAIVTLINNDSASADQSFSTSVRFTGTGLLPTAYGYPDSPTVNKPLVREAARYLQIPAIMLNNLFDITLFGFCETTVVDTLYYRLHEYYDKVTITDIDDPENNYIFERKRFLETLNCADTMYDVVMQSSGTTTTTT
jgi:hypothetical protein